MLTVNDEIFFRIMSGENFFAALVADTMEKHVRVAERLSSFLPAQRTMIRFRVALFFIKIKLHVNQPELFFAHNTPFDFWHSHFYEFI